MSTTARAFTSLKWFLSKNPENLEKVNNEINQII